MVDQNRGRTCKPKTKMTENQLIGINMLNNNKIRKK